MNDQELQKIVDDIIVEHDKHYEIKGVASLALKINNALKEVRAAQKKEDESLVWLSRFRKAEEKLKAAREALKIIDPAIGCGCGIDGPCSQCCNIWTKVEEALLKIGGGE
jgi:hypothetical protein